MASKRPRQAKPDKKDERGDLVAQLEIPMRRPLCVLVPFLLIVAASAAGLLLLEKKYKSTTLILVESEKVPERLLDNQGRRVEEVSPREWLSTLQEEITSRTRLETVIQEMDPYPESKGRVPAMVERMRGAITVNARGTDAFSIDFVHRDPTKAMQVANRLASLFIDETTKAREKQTEGAYDFIEVQLADSRKELDTVEEAQRLFREKHMGSLPQQLPANLSTLQRLQLEQQAVAENLRAAEDRAALAQKGIVLAPATDMQLQQMRLDLAALRERYTEEHPDVRALMRRIERLERGAAPVAASPAANPEAGRVRLEIAGLREKQRTIEQKMARLQAFVDEAPSTEQELGVLTRDYQKIKENYLALLNKRIEAQMAERLEQRWKGERFRVLDPAHVPYKPYFPDPMTFLLIGLSGGLAVGLGVALAAELMDHSIKSVRDLQAELPYPVLATIPHIDGKPVPAARRPAAATTGRA